MLKPEIIYKTERQSRGLYTKRDAAIFLGLEYFPFYRMVQSGLLPEPTVEMTGHRPYYSADDLETLKRMLDAGDWLGSRG